MSANNKNSEEAKPFHYLDQIPTAESDPNFWNVITSPHFLNVANYLILNELRKYPAESLSDNACRVQLAKMQAYSNLLALPRALLYQGESDPLQNDDLPE